MKRNTTKYKILKIICSAMYDGKTYQQAKNIAAKKLDLHHNTVNYHFTDLIKRSLPLLFNA